MLEILMVFGGRSENVGKSRKARSAAVRGSSHGDSILPRAFPLSCSVLCLLPSSERFARRDSVENRKQPSQTSALLHFPFLSYESASEIFWTDRMGTVTMPSPSHGTSPVCSEYVSGKMLLETDFSVKTTFPSTFQDFFAKLSEVGDDNDENSASLLENKQLLPTKNKGGETATGYRRKLPDRHWSMNRRSLRKRQNEVQSKGSARLEGKVPQQISLPGHSSSSIFVSPMTSRRRSSSIAVARVPPDLNSSGRLGKGLQMPVKSGSTPVSKDFSYHRRRGSSERAANISLETIVSEEKKRPEFLQAEQCKQWLQVNQRSSSPEPGHNPTPLKSPRSQRHSPIHVENSSYNRGRTASVPAVPSRHKPMLAQTKRNDPGVEYYRLRSFSITPNGVFNLGDSFKSRRSRSISSVNSTESSQTDASAYNRDRLPSTASQCSTGPLDDANPVPTYRVAMLGASGVGKTTLTYQFTTSEYTCAYDTSLDDEFGQKTVSVMLDGKETELEIIDHPSAEMSIETFCSTYNPDVCVVVYSVDDRTSMKVAEEMLMYLWKSDYMSSRGVILVGNKADLERKREIPTSVGRKLANGCGCKFIETSSGLDHNVDELLVGILAQVQLNPRRRRNQFAKKKIRLESGRRLLKHLLGIKRKSKSCENLFIL